MSRVIRLSLVTVLGLVVMPACPDPNNGGRDRGTEVDAGGGDDDLGTGDDAGTPPGRMPRITTCPGAPLPPLASGTCEVTAGDDARLITGDVLTPGEVFRGGQVLVGSDGRIACVGCDCATAAGADSATKITCPTGVVSPGLINTHDHITFTQNEPDPDTGERYEQRHDWRLGIRGHQRLTNAGGASQDQVRWGELRFLFGGATSTVGSGSASGLLRNLDTSANQEGLGQKAVEFETFPLGDTDGRQLASGCGYGAFPDIADILSSSDAFEPHVSEGIDAVARNEFLCLSSDMGGGKNVVVDQSAFIHAIALLPTDYQAMGAGGTAIIWSPRSNIRLYGDTANVVEAYRLGVQIALGTDWTPSGSMNMLRELRCADDLNRDYYDGFFTDEELWLMTTRWAAQVTATDDAIGALAVGLVADIAIFGRGDGAARVDHRAVISAEPADVVLVMRGGKVLYGDAPLVGALPGAGDCDEVDVCGAAKSACISSETGGKGYEALKAAARNIYPAFFCGPPDGEPTCVPSRPRSVMGSTVYTGDRTAEDSDGDGIADGEDNCPRVFNPIRPLDDGKQGNFDEDGEGDACDVCPLDPDSTSCGLPDPNDRDRDGTPDASDNCPQMRNPGQEDGDGDGKGDACDPCPEAPNPGAGACPATIYQVKDGTAAVGRTVAIADALVTGRAASGFFLQVKESDAGYQGPENSGLFVYLPANTVNVGDRVDVTSGTVQNFFGQIQLSSVTAMVKTSAGEAPPAPVREKSAGVPLTGADIATGGPSAAALEGVIVELAGVTVSSIAPAPGAADTAPTNEFVVDGMLRVNDYLYLVTPFPRVGDSFGRLAGILEFRNGNSKIEPRGASDLAAGAPRLITFGPDGFIRVGASAQPTIPSPLTVTLSSPVAQDTAVTIMSSDATKLALARGATTVTVPAGSATATVLLDGNAQAADVILTASLAGVSLPAHVRVVGATEVPALVSLAPATAAVAAGGSVMLTATLDLPAPAAGVVVSLATTGGTVPATVSVMEDKIAATFTYTQGGANPTDTVTATLAGTSKTATITLATGPDHLVINEVDYDQVAGDSDEFIEIHNPTARAIDLAGLSVVLVNGSTSQEYMPRTDLTGMLAPGAYLVLASGTVNVTDNPPMLRVVRFTADANTIQNGAPDGVAIVERASGRIVDALSYEGAITDATLTGITGTRSLVEGTALATTTADSNTAVGSLIRSPNGKDSDDADADWKFTATITPGTANVQSP